MINIRNKIQQEIVDLSFKHNFLLLTLATGVGKSLSALLVAINSIKNNGEPWLILSEEILHIDNWKKEFKKHKLEEYLKYFTFSTYASAHKYDCKNIILDEAHHALSDRRIDIIKSYNANKIIALSATFSQDKKDVLNQLGMFKEYTISLKDAIENDILPTPTIKVKYVELDKQNANMTYIKTKGLKKNRIDVHTTYLNWKKEYFKYKDVTLHISCTEQQYYNLLDIDLEYAKKNHFKLRQNWTKFSWLNLASKRKNWLASIKTPYIKEILKETKSFRFICFTSSIEQCEEVGKNTIHSKNSETHNNELIEKFNKKRIKSLFCVRKLREGMNLVDIEKAIITQIDSEDLAFYQMLGRSLRGKNPEVYLIIIKNTRDEEYFESIKEDLSEFIKY